MASIKTKKVILKGSKPAIVARGVKVSSRNLEDVAHWAPGSEATFTLKKGVETDLRVKVKTKAGFRVARIGDIVIKLDKDNFIVVKAEEFASKIEIEK